jgi:uncharacterized protein
MDTPQTQIKDITGNPAPLGLLAFGMTTVLLNFANAGFIPLTSMILAMGIFYGGIAQVIAGYMEWKKGNTFATAAFISYGFFWLSLVGLLVMPKLGWAAGPSGATMPCFLALWGVFTGVMFIGTIRLSKALMFVFFTLTVLFFLLAINDAVHPGDAFAHFTGWEGIICGASAMYTGLAQVLNELYGATILPLGAVKK